MFGYVIKHFPEIIARVISGENLTLTYDDRRSRIENKEVFKMKVGEFLKETHEKYNGKTILIDDYGIMWLVEEIGDDKKSKELYEQIIALSEKEHNETTNN